MLQAFTVEESTLVLLKKLEEIPLFENLRLVGGTSLALQLGHRHSIDLDLFGDITATHNEIYDELIKRGFDVYSRHITPRIHVFNINGVKVDIVNYPYKWIEPALETENIRLASLKDIVPMKLEAITNRGAKKDFIDIYFLLQHFSLKQMLKFYEMKYTKGSPFNVMRSLSYFEDAEEELMPKMFVPVEWENIKLTIKTAIEQF
ncbi:MAG: nucleotidyl transferase AbiEii/AbiGii toxin family protein [Candidatus Azobacteroides sp.]|nr:nucleotidyl transferase AbiEii/AbiGii toxin family protein [Candidatus Azobacteroides sp.]